MATGDGIDAEGLPQWIGSWCPAPAAVDGYAGGPGALLPAAWGIEVPGSAGEWTSTALMSVEQVADGLAGLDLGDWRGPAAESARTRMQEALAAAGAVCAQLRDAQMALDAQCRGVAQALIAAVTV